MPKHTDTRDQQAAETERLAVRVNQLEHERDQLRTELDGLHEGEEPHPDHTVITTPAQWIRRWNRATPEQRLEAAAKAIRDADRASRCFLEDHEQRLQEHDFDRALPCEQLHQAIRDLARTDSDWFHAQLRQMGRVDPAWLRDTFRAAARTEGTAL